jgi:hypothetical protein
MTTEHTKWIVRGSARPRNCATHRTYWLWCTVVSGRGTTTFPGPYRAFDRHPGTLLQALRVPSLGAPPVLTGGAAGAAQVATGAPSCMIVMLMPPQSASVCTGCWPAAPIANGAATTAIEAAPKTSPRIESRNATVVPSRLSASDILHILALTRDFFSGPVAEAGPTPRRFPPLRPRSARPCPSARWTVSRSAACAMR